MENIEVGEWIINQNRLVIGQIIGINEERQEATIKVNRLELLIGFWNIRKHSKSIIDLIEVGDVIEYQVNSLSELKVGRVKKYRDARNSKEYLGVEGFDITKIYIKSILTHEQYEQNCYKVSNDRTQ